MSLSNKLLLIFLACALIISRSEIVLGKTWHTYEVYQPSIRKYIVTEHQSHDATVVWFQDRWIAIWDDGTEKDGQKIRQSTSFDLQNWTNPIQAFSSDEGSINPIAHSDGYKEWGPSLTVVNDELWAIWNTTGTGLYFSKLEKADGKWTHRRLFGSRESNLMPEQNYPIFDSKKWRIFPINKGIIINNGRIIVPITFIELIDSEEPWWNRTKRDSVIYSDDSGKTWHLSRGTKLNRTDQLEATVWSSTSGLLNMIARYNKPLVNTVFNLKSSTSFDNGKTWTNPQLILPIESAMSKPHVIHHGKRNYLAQNDWATVSKDLVDNRRNLTLFFNRGDGYNFVAGLNFSGGDVANLSVDYPTIEIKDNFAVVIYTENTQIHSQRQTALVKIEPLPDDDIHYLFPRTARGKIENIIVDGRNVLRFYDDYSSAGVDLDPNIPHKDFLHIRFDFKVESGKKQSILRIGYPVATVWANNGIVELQIDSTTKKIGTYSDSVWSHLELTSGKGIIQARIGDSAQCVSLPHSLISDRWLYLGQGWYAGLDTPDKEEKFLVDLDSFQTKIDFRQSNCQKSTIK